VLEKQEVRLDLCFLLEWAGICHFPCLFLPGIAAPCAVVQRWDWLFIHLLIVLIRDSNYRLRSSDYPELQEGDERVQATAAITTVPYPPTPTKSVLLLTPSPLCPILAGAH
jgi:hypothetical protein